MSEQRTIGLVLYPRFTALDIVGPYEVLSRLPEQDGVGYRTRWLATSSDPVESDRGLRILPDAILGDEPIDTLVVPGGPGQMDLMADESFLGPLRATAEAARLITSVCTGSLLLGAAGLLAGKRATTHWMTHEMLSALGAEPVRERVVRDGDVITAAGVSAGIDMALTLAAELVGDEVAQMIQLGIEYDPQPPFAAGNPDVAPGSVVGALQANAAQYLL